MNWLDVAGPPGVGKSTLCDALWGPHDIRIEDRLPPASWHDFLNEVSRLFWLIKDHRTFPAAVRMVNRSVRKIATVARMPAFVPAIPEPGLPPGMWWPDDDILRVLPDEPAKPYIQTALVQRGLGFGWRLNHMGADLNELRHYFRLMPVSIGVAFLEADEAAIVARNRMRRFNPKTAHEDRAFMVPLMREPIRIAKEELRARGVPVIEIDVGGQPVEAARAQLLAFADQAPCDAAEVRLGGEGTVLSPPPWWR